jgi:hypothetical protein
VLKGGEGGFDDGPVVDTVMAVRTFREDLWL